MIVVLKREPEQFDRDTDEEREVERLHRELDEARRALDLLAQTLLGHARP